MKLELVNFCCYETKNVDFGSSGITLVSGDSGKGKSTLVKAIYWCLYNQGKNIQKDRKKRTIVNVSFDKYVIQRTKTPQSLWIKYDNQEFINDGAQGIINRIFGEDFTTTSYIQQNQQDSFITLSPSEKRVFLEKFIFADVNLTEIKTRSKAKIKECETVLAKTATQLETIKETEVQKPEKEACFKIFKKQPDLEKYEKNENIRLKNKTVLLKKTRTQLQKTEILKIHEDTKNNLLVKIKNCNEEVDKIDYIGDDELEENEEKLKAYLQSKTYYDLLKSYKNDEEKLSELKKNEEKMMSDIIAMNKSNLSEDNYDTMKKERENFLKRKEILAILKPIEIQKIRKDVDILNDRVRENTELQSKLLIQGETYECPSCNASLVLRDDGLQLSDTQISIEHNIDELDEIVRKDKKRLAELLNIVAKYDVYSKKLTEYPEKECKEHSEEELSELKKNIERIKLATFNLENKIYSSTVNILSNQLKNKKKELDKLGTTKKEKFTFNEDELRNLIATETLKRNQIISHQDNLEVFEEELKEIDKKIEEIKTNFESDKQSKSVDEFEKEISEHTENLKNLEKYKRYLIDKERYEKQLNTIKELSKKQDKYQKELDIARLLDRKIHEAISITLESAIESLNRHAQIFLDKFFPNEPISVNLSPFKETQKGDIKSEISIRIEYKGLDYEERINMLSGGEYSRVSLAFTLALAEIYNSPFILLDECTASLDQNLTTIVVESMREALPTKPIVMIAHQCVSGMFDRELQV